MKGKVLVIEDNINWQNRLQHYLEKDDFYVTIINNLEQASKVIVNERFHFITLDLQLNESTLVGNELEGFNLLKLIKKVRIENITPIMVITGYGGEYKRVTQKNAIPDAYFMEKGNFDRQSFLDIINREVIRINLRFKDDHRGH